MKKLKIEITRAQLTGFVVRFDPEDKKIKVDATIVLLTEGGKEITDYTIHTDTWNDSDKFDLPLDCYEPIIDIGNQLEKVVAKHCMDSTLHLEAPVEEKKIVRRPTKVKK